MSGTIPRHILKPPPGTIREIDLIDWAPRAKAFAPEKPHRHFRGGGTFKQDTPHPAGVTPFLS